MYKFIVSLFIINASLLGKVSGQNLIVNPGAEDPTLAGWTPAPGNTWFGSAQVTPHSGSYHFYAGNTAGTAELDQDVDVSGNATSIDAGTASYTFSGWMRVYPSFPSDEAKIIVEYRDASSSVLTSYNTGLNTTTTWKNYTDTRTAPVGTRTIRIRLQSIVHNGSDNDGYMDDLSLIGSSPAPVKLINFTATFINPSVSLTWSTASEINNDYFTIERSEDGMQWNELKIIDGAGNSSSIINYTADDPLPFAGISYYRLKQTDFDGSFTYSQVAAIRVASNQDFILYPNPASHVLYIKQLGKEVNVSFINSLGQQLYVPYTHEGETTTFSLDSLSRGTYIVRIQNKSDILFKKVVIE